MSCTVHNEISSTTLTHNTKEDYKWDNQQLEHQISQISYQKLSNRQKIIFHSLLCSDYYCSDAADLKLSDSKAKIIRIVKSKRFRQPEINVK